MNILTLDPVLVEASLPNMNHAFKVVLQDSLIKELRLHSESLYHFFYFSH